MGFKIARIAVVALLAAGSASAQPLCHTSTRIVQLPATEALARYDLSYALTNHTIYLKSSDLLEAGKAQGIGETELRALERLFDFDGTRSLVELITITRPDGKFPPLFKGLAADLIESGRAMIETDTGRFLEAVFVETRRGCGIARGFYELEASVRGRLIFVSVDSYD